MSDIYYRMKIKPAEGAENWNIRSSLAPQPSRISSQPYEGSYTGPQATSSAQFFVDDRDVIIDRALQQASKAYQVKTGNERLSEIQSVEDKVLALDERLEAIEGIAKMLKQYKQPSYTVTLAKEASELARSAMSKLEELNQMAGYAGLVKPDSAEVFADILERIITSPLMANVPEQLEKTWQSIVNLRKQIIEMVESIKNRKTEISEQLKLNYPENSYVKLDKSATFIHKLETLQSSPLV